MPGVDQPPTRPGENDEGADRGPRGNPEAESNRRTEPSLPAFPGAAPQTDDHDDDDGGWDVGHRRLFGGRRALGIGLAVLAVVAAYSIGYSRGHADLDKGSSSTTVPVTADGNAPATTVDVGSLTPLALPTERTPVDLGAGVPADVQGRGVIARGEWAATDGAIGPTRADPLPADATDPRAMGEGADLVVDTGRPVSLATVKLTAPTPLSGIVFRFKDDRNYWAAVVDPRMEHLTLYRMKDGDLLAMGFVNVKVAPGTTIGLVAAGDQVSLVLDDKAVIVDTFFGPKVSLPDEGIAGHGVGLLVGDGEPRFTDLVFG